MYEPASPSPQGSVHGQGLVRGDRVRNLGSCRVGDAARAGTKGAGSEQHVPGQVTLCHLQIRALGWAAGGIMLSCLTIPSLAGSGLSFPSFLQPIQDHPHPCPSRHREYFLPSLPLLPFSSHPHSLSMNPLCRISSITFPFLLTSDRLSCSLHPFTPACFSPFSPPASLLQDFYSLPLLLLLSLAPEAGTNPGS